MYLPGSLYSMIFLLYSWGSLFGVSSRVPLFIVIPAILVNQSMRRRIPDRDSWHPFIFPMHSWGAIDWVAIKELDLSQYFGGTLSSIMYIHYFRQFLKYQGWVAESSASAWGTALGPREAKGKAGFEML